MSKLTISDLHFCDISLDAGVEVRGGSSRYGSVDVDSDVSHDSDVDVDFDGHNAGVSYGTTSGHAEALSWKGKADAKTNSKAWAKTY
jgi:hypothetical protein